MFHDLIRDLEADGHTIIITSRPLANTVELLDQRVLKHTVVGDHYGKNFYKKVFGYPIRVLQLRKFLASQKPDLAVSQSSFHSPVVAKLLGIPSIYTNDNEHAMGNKPSFLCATTILIPENLAISKVARNGVSAKKVIQYPGVKEGIYLWSKGEKIQQQRSQNQSKEINIYIRPEPQTAQYYKGKENFLDDTIVALQGKYKITVLPRDANQASHYKQEKFSATHVPDKPMSFDVIAANCSIFIGAGGSMTRELAILGIPTISVYQDELLDVDQFLLAKGLILHEPMLTPEKVESYISSLQNKPPALELMNKGKEAYQLFKKEILKFKKK
jgi:predicted glycosyltransferase